MTPAPRQTTATCRDCAAHGEVEFLFDHGDRTFCTNPWCGYEVVRDAAPEAPESGVQPPLF
ncbi:MAG TPA: hypothetical protein VIG97_01360 [Luteimonas sp.]